jgi:hypothetical protein
MRVNKSKNTKIENYLNTTYYKRIRMDVKKEQYKIIKDRFNSLGAELVTTFDDFYGKKMKMADKFDIICSCTHPRTVAYNDFRRNPYHKCLKCSTRNKNGSKVSYQEIVRRFEELGCKVLTTEEEFNNNDMNIHSCFNTIMTCGHEREIEYMKLKLHPYKSCYECSKNSQYAPLRKPYEEIVQKFKEWNCELMTTFEEYNEKQIGYYGDYTVKMTCGHQRITSIPGMIGSKEFECKECSIKKMIVRLKDKSKTDEGEPTGNVCEYKAFCYIRELLQERFDVKKLHEGCLADFAIKPKEIEEDKWLQIQLKSTEDYCIEKEGCFKFYFHKANYEGMPIICCCLKYAKILIFNGKDFKDVGGITIGKKSKYDKYAIDSKNLCDKIFDVYNAYELYHFDSIDIPQNEVQKREREYKKKRERLIDFLKYDYPEIEGLVWDFKVNGLKVQEKVVEESKTYKGYYGVTLCKSGGRKNKKTTKQPYTQGDNNIYWIQLQDSQYFYIFPENLLIEHTIIKTNDDNKASMRLNLYPLDINKKNKSSRWAREYLFDYENLDANKIKGMFNL